MSAGRGSILVAIALALSGCCSNVTTDPRAGGLVGGMCGTTTGAYDRRIANLELQSDTLQVANNRLEARLGSQRREIGALDSEIAARRSKLQKAQQELATLRRQAAQKQELRAEITALMQEAGRREQRIIAIEAGMRTARNDSIREKARMEATQVLIDDLLARIRALRASLN